MHVFLVHSSITFLVAREIIRNKNLQNNEVVFLTDRNFDVQKYCDEFRAVKFKYNWQTNPFIDSNNPIYLLRTLHVFDRHITEITTGRNYYIYLPHTHNTIYQVLTTHSKCRGFSYIEEGTLSFLTQDEMPSGLKPVTTKLKIRFSYLFRIKSRQEPFHNDYDMAYFITPGAFPFLKNKEKLELNVENNKGFSHMSNSHIIVFDPASKYNLTTPQAYIHAVLSLLDYFVNNNIPVVYFKLHPEHMKDGDQDAFLYRELMESYTVKSGVKFIELNQDVSLEEISIYAANVTFYISVSSVGIYASRYNQKVVSFANKISEIDKGFESTTGRLSRWMDSYDNLK